MSRDQWVAPSGMSYTVALLVMQITVFLISMALSSLPPTHANWIHVNYAFQAFPPTSVLPQWLRECAKIHPDPDAQCLRVHRVQVLCGPLWWATLAQGLNAYFRQGQTFSLPCYFITLDFAGFSLALVRMYAVDAVAGEMPISDTAVAAGAPGRWASVDDGELF
ncbi:hypothetical protein B0H19DRAFT_1084352 [Mycena capillaripes]|nr:hypothetical protein B0H19DRAFT_1084352 [Mycena capillaripes]